LDEDTHRFIVCEGAHRLRRRASFYDKQSFYDVYEGAHRFSEGGAHRLLTPVSVFRSTNTNIVVVPTVMPCYSQFPFGAK
jgi:hypothetical protein